MLVTVPKALLKDLSILISSLLNVQSNSPGTFSKYCGLLLQKHLCYKTIRLSGYKTKAKFPINQWFCMQQFGAKRNVSKGSLVTKKSVLSRIVMAQSFLYTSVEQVKTSDLKAPFFKNNFICPVYQRDKKNLI